MLFTCNSSSNQYLSSPSIILSSPITSKNHHRPTGLIDLLFLSTWNFLLKASSFQWLSQTLFLFISSFSFVFDPFRTKRYYVKSFTFTPHPWEIDSTSIKDTSLDLTNKPFDWSHCYNANSFPSMFICAFIVVGDIIKSNGEDWRFSKMMKGGVVSHQWIQSIQIQFD